MDGTLYEISEVPALNRKTKHEIEAVVDRIVVREGIEARLADSFETALGLADGVVYAEPPDAPKDGSARITFSSRFACPVSGFSIEEIEPRLFSFNSPHGACPACDGLGMESFFDAALVVPDDRRPLNAGAVAHLGAAARRPITSRTLQGIARHFKVRMTMPWGDLPERVQNAILNGTGDESVEITYKDGVRAYAVNKPFEGVLKNLARRWKETDSAWVREELSRYQAEKPCDVCHGARLKPEALAVKIAGSTIAAASDLAIRQAHCPGSRACSTSSPRSGRRSRAAFCARSSTGCGSSWMLGSTTSPSPAARRRCRVARASASASRARSARGLTGVLYVLDEPSIGLHQRDNERLLGTLQAAEGARQHRARGGA